MSYAIPEAVQPHADYTLLNFREAASFLTLSIPSFWRRVADGTIPKPIKIGHSSRWLKSELAAFVEIARAKRDG